MKIIGITGKSGSGKTTFASLLSQKLNCKYIDIDKIGHEAIFQPEISQALCEKFGNEILDENGNINRKKLGDIVFAQKDKMQILTDLTWDYMQKQLDHILSLDDKIIIFEWMLLPISKYWEQCDCKILIKSNDKTRKNIVLKRDNISEEYFDKRDSSSIDYSQVTFDYIFENDYQPETMDKILNELKKILDNN